MAKTSYLNLTNKILRRINQAAISDVTAATGHALIIMNFINEAQNELFTEANWYSLYTTRAFSTVTYTASTIAFNNANPDTITDSASGFGSFENGTEILISGSSSNDGAYTINTAAAGTLTLQTADSLTAESVGNSIVVTVISYPVASDFGRTIDLIDTTNNWLLTEDATRGMDEADPDADYTGNPTHFTLQGSNYRLYPIPAGIYTIRDRYWKQPIALAANADTSDLPIEAENCIILWIHYQMLEYLNKFDSADRKRMEFERALKRAKLMNQKMIDRMYAFQPSRREDGIHITRFPSNYGVRYW